MKYYVRGRKKNDENGGPIFEIGHWHATKEAAELAAENARNNGWVFVGVTTEPMQSKSSRPKRRTGQRQTRKLSPR